MGIKIMLELPDELMHSIKVRAAETDCKLKDVVSGLMRLLDTNIISEIIRATPRACRSNRASPNTSSARSWTFCRI